MMESDGNERDRAEGSAEISDADADERWVQAVAEAPTFGEALGRHLQAVREEKGSTAEDVAQAAQRLGLSWHRPTVRQIERGQRALSATELVMLPLLYGRPLGELLPQESETVRLTSQLTVYGREARRVLGGDYNPRAAAFRAPGGWHVKGWSDQSGEEMAERAMRAMTALSERSPWPKGVETRYLAQPDEAESKAAKRLNTTPHYVAHAARETWGHGLAEEREARLRARGELPEGKRALQSARGHITRALAAELEPVVKAYEEQRGEPEQLDPADFGPMKVTRKGRETDG
ncbi:helix-turn-helix domain-containing protein [Streptomyces sp. NPDC059037]|uniref:helix-turn-helix domain-containing protein n=1 Tax=Streptomyces sp. NPDC059037 TaxID=3346710 RepID=UPI0036CC7554